MTRYVWASQLIGGLDVLDISSGAGAAAELLRGGGARSVTPVLVEQPRGPVVSHAEFRPTFRHPDGRRLDLPESSFDAIVAFEAIERVPSPAMLVSELHQALRPEGFVIVSATGEPAELSNAQLGRALGSDQLERLLRVWFRNCRLHRQHLWVMSLIGHGAMVGVGEDAVIAGGSFPGLCAPAARDQVTIAVASNRALPDASSTGLLLDAYPRRCAEPRYEALQEEVARALEELETIRLREAQATRQMQMVRAALKDIRAQIGALLSSGA